MTSTEVATTPNEDRVFFARHDASFDTFLNDYTLDGFLKALLSRISDNSNHVQTLVLAPTRELALQITEVMKKFAKPMSIKVHACVGGTALIVEKIALANGAHIIVGTPGRVKHMITLRAYLVLFSTVLMKITTNLTSDQAMGLLKVHLFSLFPVLNTVDLFVMYDFRRLLSKDMREALSSIITSLPEDIQKGKCVCTSSMPRAQRQLEQFCREMSLCKFCDMSPNELLERDVPTPESGIDDGVEAMDCEEPVGDENDQANSLTDTRYILAAIQGVDVERKAVQVLVIAPRKDEIKQICEELQRFLSSTKILLHGSCEQTKLRDDGYVLRNGVHVLVAPPQRIRDLLRCEFLNADCIRVLVMVKAEELFCTGFKTLVHDIIQSLPESVQCVLLSKKELIHASEADGAISPYEKLAQSEPRESVINRRRHINIEVQDDQQTERALDFCARNVATKKTQLEVLCDLYPKLEYERAVIICKWPKKAAWIQEHLAARGYHVVCLVGMKTKKFRDEMQKFESSLSGVVLITETSANLFKDKEISVVVNYEMPRKAKGYVSRVAPVDIERERTVVNLIKNKREADLMETVQSQYGISIEHFINPNCIKF